MIQVNFTTRDYDESTGRWVRRPVAQLVADVQDMTISGPLPTGSAPTSRSSTRRPPSA